MENSRIELRGIVLPVQMGGLLGGPKGMLAPPLSNYWGGLAPPGPPSSYAYVPLSSLHKIVCNGFTLEHKKVSRRFRHRIYTRIAKKRRKKPNVGIYRFMVFTDLYYSFPVKRISHIS